MKNEIVEFIKAAIRNPKEVSTIFPTTSALANNLLAHAEIARAELVVELGAGTGAITKHLIPKLSNPEKYLGVELDGKMVEFLTGAFPGAKFQQGYAESIGNWVQPQTADAIVSSLPWTLFPDDVQERTITAILQALKPHGVFLTYICANAIWYSQARSFVKKLNREFASVYRSPIELRNIPPAIIFKATK